MIRPDLVVAVPAHDEELLIGGCLRSVVTAVGRAVAERDVRPFIAVAAHRCDDATAGVARDVLAASGLAHLVLTDTEPGPVGAVRGRLLDAVADRVDPTEDAWLLNTDADSTVPPDWATSVLELAEAGAAAVTGMVEIVDWHATVAARTRYAEIIAAGMTATGHRHVYGANLAVAWRHYRRVGGFRPVPHGEDSDLVARLQSVGLPAVSTLLPVVRTSGRMPGRAPLGLGALLHTVTAADTATSADPAGTAAVERL